MEDILIRRIETSDPLYQQERDLRNRILLRPIGIPDFGWEKNDSFSWHFVALNNAQVVGCVVLVPLDNGHSSAQLIQMAVEPTFQKKGLGKKLVEVLVGFAREQGLRRIEIHSRADVTSFYENLGFEVYGESFEEVGVKHRHMAMLLEE